MVSALEMEYDLLVLGAGPGGYVAAIRGAQLGLKTAVMEKKNIGGVCLNTGCIPSKSLISSASVFSEVKRLEGMGVKTDLSGFDYGKVHGQSRETAATLSKGVQYLLEKNGVTLIKEEGKLSGTHEVTTSSGRKIQACNIMIATGSRPRTIPGLEYDHTNVCSSEDMILCEVLPQSLCIIGGGAIGCEFAYIMNAFGVTVTLVEMTDHLLPNEDGEVAKVLASSFKKKGISVQLQSKAEIESNTPDGVTVKITNAKGKEKQLQTEKVLVVTGRMPNTEGIGLEELGIVTDRGFIMVNENYQTNVPSVYAIGDVIPGAMLAHAASKEGEYASEFIAGRAEHKKELDSFVPGCVYCEPQVAGFGETQESAKAVDEDAKAFKFSFRGIGKAVAINKSEGFVKIITDSRGKILGAHIIGEGATEMIHELALAAWKGIHVQDVADMIHAHPTLSEGIMECARGFDNKVIHG